jgi:hypothetical protein
MCRFEPQIYATGFFQPPTRHDDVLWRRADVSEYPFDGRFNNVSGSSSDPRTSFSSGCGEERTPKRLATRLLASKCNELKTSPKNQNHRNDDQSLS